MTPSDTVNEFMRRFCAKDLDGACELVTGDVEYDNVPMGKNYGPDGIKAFVGAMIDGIDSIDFIVHREAATGNLVLNERIPFVTFLLPPSCTRLGAEFVVEVEHEGAVFLKYRLETQ